MNNMQNLKYDLTLHCASIMVQNDIASGKIPPDIYSVRKGMLSYAIDFASILTDGTMSGDSLDGLLKLFR